MLAEFLPKPAASRRISLILVALIVLAWGLLFAWQRSPYAGLLGHEALAHHHVSFITHLALFLLSWLLMIVAMMLPVNLPVMIDARGERPSGVFTITAVVLGYIIPWVLFGLLAFLGDSALHELTEHGGPLEGASGFIAPLIILMASIYQLTPLKRAFTERCGLPVKPGMQDARGQTRAALSRGLRLGAICMGSCWSLMLLMFALGHHRLDWMLVIGGMVFAERWMPRGYRLSRIAGLALLLWAGWSVMAVV